MAETTLLPDDEANEKTPTDKDALFLRLKAWHKEASEHLADWRKDAREDYAFVAGDQWDAEDVAKLREEMRPVITFNRVQPVVDSVTGMEVGNRQEVKFHPREIQPDDAGKGELLSNAADFFRDECDAEDEESDAFWDVVVAGMGATETRVDFEDDPEGALPIDRLDPLCVWYDPTARKRNLADRRFCGYDKTDVPIEEAREMFPDAEDEDLHAGWAQHAQKETDPHDATPALAYNKDDDPEGTLSGRKKVTIVYVEWWDRETYYRVVDQSTGESAEFDEKRYAKLLETGMGIKGAKFTRKVHKRAFLGNKVLETGPAKCKYGFSINFMTGKRDRNKGVYYGLVRSLKDPQRWANKFFSQMLHIVNTSAKGAPMAEKNAFDNPRRAEEDWARPDRIVWLKDGALKDARVQPRNPVALPPGLDKLLEFTIASIPQVTGVNFELMGMVEREQPGILEHQRKQAGMTILATLFDSLRRYRKEQGRVYLHLIQEYIPANRLIRIDTKQGPKYAPLVKDPNQTKYDVIVDEAPSSPNQKEAAWAAMQPMLPLLKDAPPQIMAHVIKTSPLPESVAEEIAQLLNQMGQQQIPPEVQKGIEQLQQQLQKLMQEKQKLEQQIQELRMDNTADIMKAQSDAQIAQQKLELEKLKAGVEIEIEQTRLNLERQKAQAGVETEQMKAQNQMSVEREKMDLAKQQASNQNQLDRDKFETESDIKARAAGVGKKKPAKKRYKVSKRDDRGDIAEIEAEDVA